MSWIASGVAAGTAVLGAVNAGEQRKSQQRANQAQGEISGAQMAMSPWTKMAPQQANLTPVTASPVGGFAQGALGGAMFAKSNGVGAFAPQNPNEYMGGGAGSGVPSEDEVSKWMRAKPK